MTTLKLDGTPGSAMRPDPTLSALCRAPATQQANEQLTAGELRHELDAVADDLDAVLGRLQKDEEES